VAPKSKKRRGRPPVEIDGDMVRQLSMISCSTETIAQHFHCHRHTIENRFRYQLDEDRSGGQIRVRGKLFQAAMNGSQRTLEVCAVNLCGWSLNKPEVSITTNVIQTAAPRRSEAETKAHLVELQRAVWAEARRLENVQNQQQPLPPALAEGFRGAATPNFRHGKK
jgi:hypothetical protein